MSKKRKVQLHGVLHPPSVRVVMVRDVPVQRFLCNVLPVSPWPGVGFDSSHSCQILLDAGPVRPRLEHGRTACKLWCLNGRKVVACGAGLNRLRRRRVLKRVVLSVVWGGVTHHLRGVRGPSLRQRHRGVVRARWWSEGFLGHKPLARGSDCCCRRRGATLKV